MERLVMWCLGIYSFGAFGMWLLVGELTHDWHTGVVVGSTIALLSLAFGLIVLALDGLLGTVLPIALALSSVPIGFLAQTNHGGSFRVLFWTFFWILIAAGVAWCLRWLYRKANKGRSWRY